MINRETIAAVLIVAVPSQFPLIQAFPLTNLFSLAFLILDFVKRRSRNGIQNVNLSTEGKFYRFFLSRSHHRLSAEKKKENRLMHQQKHDVQLEFLN